MTTEEIILDAETKVLAGKLLNRETLIKLLEIDPYSEAADLLGSAARRTAHVAAGNRSRIWASIGVDYKPCAMNCRFCSFAEAWGGAKDAHILTLEEILSHAQKFIDDGADWITLRTTENYAFSDLASLARKIRKDIPGNYKLVANTGEMNDLRAAELKRAGFSIVYHAIRLREGTDTPFSPQEREETLVEITRSGLDLAFLVEPIGVEHSNEEIADTFMLAMKYGAKLSGAMARVPIEGTPMYDLGPLPERRLAQIAAVTRLGAGIGVKDICVHPSSKTAMSWGANVAVVDVGAVPRSTGVSCTEWNGFDVKTALDWFNGAGYRHDQEASIQRNREGIGV